MKLFFAGVLFVLTGAFASAPLLAAVEDEAREILAEAHLAGGEYEKASEEYTRILEKKPQDIKARLALADLLSWQKRYGESIQEYETILKDEPDNQDARLKLARVHLWNKNPEQARILSEEILSKNPQDRGARSTLNEMKISLGDIYITAGDYGKAERVYREILETEDNVQAKERLALLRAYSRHYEEALEFYDKILAENETSETRLHKARVLGWAKRFDDSTREYERLLQKEADPKVRMEMEAKRLNWGRRPVHAAQAYEKLLQEDPQNLEARFDLSELYASQSFWPEAEKEYEAILEIAPGHFRAKAGLEKARLVSERPSLISGVSFVEAKSPTRESDVNKGAFSNAMNIPVTKRLNLGLENEMARRYFSDRERVSEITNKVRMSYAEGSRQRLDAFWGVVTSNGGVPTAQPFGASYRARVHDAFTPSLSFERGRVENTGLAIARGLTADHFKERIEWDVARRWRLGEDYVYSNISDGNVKNEAGVDIAYLFSFEPKKLSLTHRSVFTDYHDTVRDYFSPKSFWTYSLALEWKHYLNKEEIFFGAKDLYYALRYEVSVDSEDVIGHHFSADIHWDIRPDWSWHVKGILSETWSKVYFDRSLETYLRHYF